MIPFRLNILVFLIAFPSIYAENELAKFISLISDFNKEKTVRKALEISIFARSMPDDLRNIENEKEKLIALLKSLSLIKYLQITDFDFSNPPLMNVTPPRNSGVIVGTHPSYVKDPILREEYIAAIAKNRAHSEVYLAQRQLKQEEEFLLLYIKVFLSNHKDIKDKENLFQIIEKAELTKEIKTNLLNGNFD